MELLITGTGRVGSVQPVQNVGETKVLNFTLAVNDYQGKEKGNITTWLSMSYWGDRAENIAKYISVGEEIGFIAKLADKPRVYQNSSGEWVGQYVATARYIDAFIGGNSNSPSSNKPAQEEDEDDFPF